MKKLLKSTFYVVAAALSSTASLVGYNEYQKSQFSAANPLFAENLESLADPSGSDMPEHYGPALEVKHKTLDVILSYNDTLARVSLSDEDYSTFSSKIKYMATYDSKNIPQKYLDFVTHHEEMNLWTGTRLEFVLNGYFDNCRNWDLTSLDNGKPAESVYLTESSFLAAFR